MVIEKKMKQFNKGVEKMKVLYVTAECWPFAKTGGLGDVAYALPKALK